MGTAVVPAGMGELAASLRTIAHFLRWVVEQSELTRPGYTSHLRDNLADVDQRLDRAIESIERIESEDDPLFRLLDVHGLTGSQLQMKLAIGRQLSREVRQAAQVPSPSKRPGVIGTIVARVLDPVFKWMNMVLGSLSTAIPGLGAVQEYKECVELSVDVAKQTSLPPDDALPR